jgi:DNA-binding MarR family transcriptional regulator
MLATELARESLLSSGAMTHRIDRLSKRGLVMRSSDPEDRRAVWVSLTDEGKQLVDRALEARLGLVEYHVAGLSAEERRSLSSGLRKVMAAATRLPLSA